MQFEIKYPPDDTLRRKIATMAEFLSIANRIEAHKKLGISGIATTVAESADENEIADWLRLSGMSVQVRPDKILLIDWGGDPVQDAANALREKKVLVRVRRRKLAEGTRAYLQVKGDGTHWYAHNVLMKKVEEFFPHARITSGVYGSDKFNATIALEA